MSTTRSLTTNMCGSGATRLALAASRSTLDRQARLFWPSMFIAHEPQMPSLVVEVVVVGRGGGGPAAGGGGVVSYSSVSVCVSQGQRCSGGKDNGCTAQHQDSRQSQPCSSRVQGVPARASE